MLKSVLKCMESIRIKKNGSKKIQYLSANSVGGGGGSGPSWSKANFLNFIFFEPFSKLKCFLRPFLKTRSHDGSGHPSKKPSLVPSGPGSVRFRFRFCHIFYINFYITWGTTFFWQVGKCYIWLRPYRWGLWFGTYLGWNFMFGLRYRGQNVSKLLFFDTNAQNRIRKELFKWSEIWHEHRPIYGTDSWLRKFGGPWHKKRGLLGSEKLSSIVAGGFSHFWASRSPLRQKWHIPNCS